MAVIETYGTGRKHIRRSKIVSYIETHTQNINARVNFPVAATETPVITGKLYICGSFLRYNNF